MELSQAGVTACVARGLAVVQGDADTDLRDYPDAGLRLRDPDPDPAGDARAARRCCSRLLRIGERAIVSFPNFGHWQVRLRAAVRRPHARDAVAALHVVRHAQHPPLHHRRLPRAVPRHGRAGRARHRAEPQQPAASTCRRCSPTCSASRRCSCCGASCRNCGKLFRGLSDCGKDPSLRRGGYPALLGMTQGQAPAARTPPRCRLPGASRSRGGGRSGRPCCRSGLRAASAGPAHRLRPAGPSGSRCRARRCGSGAAR